METSRSIQCHVWILPDSFYLYSKEVLRSTYKVQSFCRALRVFSQIQIDKKFNGIADDGDCEQDDKLKPLDCSRYL